MAFALEDVLFRSAIAASVLRRTSFTRSSCCLSTGSVAEDDEVRISAFSERDDGERVSWRESELADGSIRGLSAGNTAEPVVGSSVGGGEGEVRDCSESEEPHKACASAFFLRVALDGSGSVVEWATTSVSILNSIGVLEIFVRGACMLFTTESKRALAFDALSWDVGRNDPCWMVSAAYTLFRPATNQ